MLNCMATNKELYLVPFIVHVCDISHKITGNFKTIDQILEYNLPLFSQSPTKHDVLIEQIHSV